MSGSGSVFLDTNILVYAHEAGGSRKKLTSRGLIADAMLEGRARVSTQVLTEFASVALRKLQLPVSVVERELDLLEAIPTTVVSRSTLRRALRLLAEHSLSFWDSLVVASALEAGCGVLYSEDLNPGEKIEGLEVVNPFREP